jgi:hypothetical protein
VIIRSASNLSPPRPDFSRESPSERFPSPLQRGGIFFEPEVSRYEADL